MKKNKMLGDMLVEAGLINESQLELALLMQKKWGEKLGFTLVKMGVLSDSDIASVLELQLGMKCLSLDDIRIPPEALNAVKPMMARGYCIMPVDVDDRTLTIATMDPTDLNALDAIGFALGRSVKPVLALGSQIRQAIEKYYGSADLEALADAGEEAGEEGGLETMEGEALGVDEGDPAALRSLRRKFEALAGLLLEKGLITEEELRRKTTGKKTSPEVKGRS